jgi:hypothetical protein
MKRLFSAVVLVIPTIFLFAVASRQSGGTIKGTVAIVEGSLVPGAEVIARDEAGRCTLRTITDHDGRFSFSGLPTGEYSLVVRYPGCNPLELHSIPVRENVLELELSLIPQGDPDYPPNILFHGRVSAHFESSTPEAHKITTEQGRSAIPRFVLDRSPFTIYSLAKLLNEPETYHDLVIPSAAVSKGRPIIESVRPYRHPGPVGVLESGSLVEIRGRNFESVTQVVVGGRGSPPLLSNAERLVGRIQGLGPSRIQVATAWGFTSVPAEVVLVRVKPERLPPPVLKPGESVQILLRVEGSAKPIVVLFTATSPSVRIGNGGGTVRIGSSGGEQNMLHLPLEALRPGSYEIVYRLAAGPGSGG